MFYQSKQYQNNIKTIQTPNSFFDTLITIYSEESKEEEEDVELDPNIARHATPNRGVFTLKRNKGRK